MAGNERFILVCAAIALFLSTGCQTIEARKLAREGNEAYLAYDYFGAIKKYLEVETLDPETPNLYVNLGYAFFSVYDPEPDPTKCDQRCGEDKACKPLCLAELQEGKLAATKAVAAFEKHLEKFPDDETVRMFLIKTLLKAAPFEKPMADKALQTFLGMLEVNPKDPEARQYLITLFIDCRRYDDAVKFFEPDLKRKPDDIETMKILAIIADKSKRTQDAIEWYWRRADAISDQEKKAVLYYEVGTYVWNLLHYQPDRATGVAAVKLADQGIEASFRAMKLKEKYAEAIAYANLLYLKRMTYESLELGRTFSQLVSFDLRKTAGQILQERKEAQKVEGKPQDGQTSEPEVSPGAKSAADLTPAAKG